METVHVPLRRGLDGPCRAALRPLDGDAALGWRRGVVAGESAAARVTGLLARQGVAIGERAATAADVRALTLGDRERLCLALFGDAFGPTLALVGDCAGCGERIEFELAPDALRREGDAAAWGRVEAGKRAWRVRPPSGADAEAAALADDPGASLLDACVEGAVPEAPLEALGDELARLDPEAAAAVALTCPACGRPGAYEVDGATLLDEQLPSGDALVEAVDLLARRYGWTERDVLAVPLARLRAYLAMPAPEPT